MQYAKLFTPFFIGNCEIKNRIVMPPMMMGFGGFDGTPTEEMIRYYEERAKGGTGLIATEITRVNDITGAAAFNQLGISHDYHIAPLRQFADRIHAHGAKFFVQLHHPGRQNIGLAVGTVPLCIVMKKFFKKFDKIFFKLAPTAGKFLLDKNIVPASVCPSKTQPSYFSGGRVRALRHGEIKALIKDFIDGAIRAQKAGVDGVILHAAHGYLIQQFLSPYTNNREDEYGGNLRNRMRFLLEIIAGIKESCPGYPIIVRLSVDEHYDKIGLPNRGYRIDTGVEMAKALEDAGIDALDVSCGAYDTFNYWLEPSSFPGGWRTDMIKAVRAAVKLPIIAVNLIRTPEEAEKQLRDDISDFVALGRPHIADPYFAKKAESGREKEIKRCICCLHCFESMQHNAFIGTHGTCAVNPFVGIENYEPPKNGAGKRVVIVGAGVAGLTSAEVLAKRGFNVTVFEKEKKPGGQVALAASEKTKERIGHCVQDLEYAARLAGARIHYGVTATKELIDEFNPYAIIIATGGTPIFPKSIEGIDKPHVFPSTDIFKKNTEIRERNVAVIGSGMTGLDTALILAAAKNSVTVVEMASSPAPGMWMQHADDVIPRLASFDAKILTNSKLIKIEDDGIVVLDTKTKNTKKLQVDNVIIAMGVKPENSLHAELKDSYVRVHTIGDAVKPGRIANAVESAFKTACEL
ncbi:MAG: NAD(P)/FAD-dependent oxidoreductase [Clostridiales bacterium]|jgi:2,4-dienoyl-CoA reductase-like NADH-dependent reductase (Old Yellow Enzyme family)/thioredoxin reductase|nr:NAD(P)/FAD-dependent oxidoreductase [Clostridiales bacterium]